MDPLIRITQQPEMMDGKACIRGMRVTVGMIVCQIGAGHSIDEVLADYPYLEREDILQALLYTAWRAEEREVVLATGAAPAVAAPAPCRNCRSTSLFPLTRPYGCV